MHQPLLVTRTCITQPQPYHYVFMSYAHTSFFFLPIHVVPRLPTAAPPTHTQRLCPSLPGRGPHGTARPATMPPASTHGTSRGGARLAQTRGALHQPTTPRPQPCPVRYKYKMHIVDIYKKTKGSANEPVKMPPRATQGPYMGQAAG